MPRSTDRQVQTKLEGKCFQLAVAPKKKPHKNSQKGRFFRGDQVYTKGSTVFSKLSPNLDPYLEQALPHNFPRTLRKYGSNEADARLNSRCAGGSLSNRFFYCNHDNRLRTSDHRLYRTSLSEKASKGQIKERYSCVTDLAVSGVKVAVSPRPIGKYKDEWANDVCYGRNSWRPFSNSLLNMESPVNCVDFGIRDFLNQRYSEDSDSFIDGDCTYVNPPSRLSVESLIEAAPITTDAWLAEDNVPTTEKTATRKSQSLGNSSSNQDCRKCISFYLAEREKQTSAMIRRKMSPHVFYSSQSSADFFAARSQANVCLTKNAKEPIRSNSADTLPVPRCNLSHQNSIIMEVSQEPPVTSLAPLITSQADCGAMINSKQNGCDVLTSLTAKLERLSVEMEMAFDSDVKIGESKNSDGESSDNKDEDIQKINGDHQFEKTCLENLVGLSSDRQHDDQFVEERNEDIQQ